jgi:hypothetical protein
VPPELSTASPEACRRPAGEASAQRLYRRSKSSDGDAQESAHSDRWTRRSCCESKPIFLMQSPGYFLFTTISHGGHQPRLRRDDAGLGRSDRIDRPLDFQSMNRLHSRKQDRAATRDRWVGGRPAAQVGKQPGPPHPSWDLGLEGSVEGPGPARAQPRDGTRPGRADCCEGEIYRVGFKVARINRLSRHDHEAPAASARGQTADTASRRLTRASGRRSLHCNLRSRASSDNDTTMHDWPNGAGVMR